MDMHTKRTIVPAGLLAGLLAATALPLGADEELSSGGQFENQKFGAAFRYRLENVYQDSFDHDAIASTLRARVNYKTGEQKGFGFFAEADYVAELGFDEFNAGGGNTPDREQYPVVADPEGFDLNQVYLQWRSGKGTLVRGGRERIIYDNARFVGNVGWRQNEQTFDGVYFQHKAGGFDWQGAWVGQVNRIFGNDVPAGEHDNNTWLLNGSKNWDGIGKLVAYYYDIHNKDAAAFSTRSYGVRFSGSRPAGGVKVGYTGEIARQDDAHNNTVSYDAMYYRVDLSMTIAKVTPYIGFESLGGDADIAGAAFRTPLATLHAFNGWADKFLTTPDAGLEDFFIGVKGSVGKMKWNVLWHDFKGEDSSQDFGSELDASIGANFADSWGVLFKTAFFNGAERSPYDDTTKLWIQLTAAF